MAAVALEKNMSTGEGCFPPVQAQGPYTTKSFFNGKAIQLKGVTMYKPHVCGTTTHSGALRLTSSGSSTFFLEGKAVCRIGDDIACGDCIAEGSDTAYVG